MSGYQELSYRERRICEERDRGASLEALAEQFEVTPERIRQYENQAREKLARLPLVGERLETLIDRTIHLARGTDSSDLSIRAMVVAPFRAAPTLPALDAERKSIIKPGEEFEAARDVLAAEIGDPAGFAAADLLYRALDAVEAVRYADVPRKPIVDRPEA